MTGLFPEGFATIVPRFTSQPRQKSYPSHLLGEGRAFDTFCGGIRDD